MARRSIYYFIVFWIAMVSKGYANSKVVSQYYQSLNIHNSYAAKVIISQLYANETTSSVEVNVHKRWSASGYSSNISYIDYNGDEILINIVIEKNSPSAVMYKNNIRLEVSSNDIIDVLDDMGLLYVEYLDWSHRYYNFELIKESQENLYFKGIYSGEEPQKYSAMHMVFEKTTNVPVKIIFFNGDNKKGSVQISTGGSVKLNDSCIPTSYFIKTDDRTINVSIVDIKLGVLM